MSSPQRRSEQGRRGSGGRCCVRVAAGRRSSPKILLFRLEMFVAISAWGSDYSSSTAICHLPVSSSHLPNSCFGRLMSPCLAFVTNHPAPICPDYCMSSVMDCSEGQGGLFSVKSTQEAGFCKSEYEWIFLSADWMDHRLLHLHIFSNIYTAISEGKLRQLGSMSCVKAKRHS